MDIAIIGAGISGLGAAHALQQRHRVVVFEQDARAGGHTNTIEVPTPAGPQPIDTGWIVFNAQNYPNLAALFAELDVPVRPTRMSFSVSLGDGAYEWRGSDNPLSFFAQPGNLLRPAHWRLLRDILALNARCRKLLREDRLPDGTLGAFLDAQGFGGELRSRYLLPMAGLIWSCSPAEAAEYPAADFMRFFEAHGLFSTMNQPCWNTVVGGSQVYVRRLLQRFAGTLRLATPVRRVERAADGVRVHSAAGVERFDAVISAVHADQALRLLGAADDTERRVLRGIPYTRSRCVLHTDRSFLPRRRFAWASWNYLHPRDEVHREPISGSYWMNQLQGIASETPYIVTLNPRRPIAAAQVLYETDYEHPFYGPASVDTHRDLSAMQGRGGLWWAGAWTGFGFHEDGLKSALAVVARLDPHCLPTWAVLGAAPSPAAAAPAAGALHAVAVP
ncbi:NAD(P)/FAD-dependent oxidoreductase [Solimonas soli]|uniref:NAD(P)/FAD-dependent oxidoreductase n=1 Tax=Solimonas soli TaxID=413479 RepID=UPI0004B032BD|nr:FAD-dependent oxidoreductase [Solimonas soli]